MWADVGGAPGFSSGAANQASFRVKGGFVIQTTDAAGTGCVIPAGGGAWSCSSDRELKRDLVATDSREILTRLLGIPVATWSLQSQDPSIRHIGPTAQDFYAAFAVGEDDRHIGTTDANGVTFAAIQGLYEVVQDKDSRLAKLEDEISELRAQNVALESRLVALERSAVSAQTTTATPMEASLASGWPVTIGLVLAGMGWRRRLTRH